MQIDTVWEICLNFEYDYKSLFNGLDSFLKEHKKKQILDCACGTGFLTLDLIKKGYSITCSDGSATMLKQFKKNAKEKGIIVNPVKLLWSSLAEKFENKYDIVICRGSSLIYAGSWDESNKNNKEVILNSLSNFYSCLKPGGFLYIDTTPSNKLKNTAIQYNEYNEKIINGNKVRLIETIKTDIRNKTRTWTPTVIINNKQFTFERNSYYLPHEELKCLLKDCGFTSVKKKKVLGEHYDVFIAYKK